MYTIDYEKIVREIDSDLMIYRDDDFVSLLYPYPPKNSNIVFQELENALVVWSNGYLTKSMYEVFSIILRNVDVDIIFPFVESEEEYQAVIAVGAEPTEFDAECCEDLCRDYGSFLLRKEANHDV